MLVFPCGSEIGTEIHQALRYSLHVELYGASSVEDHGAFRYERYRGDLPNIADEGFDEAFEALVADWKIDLVFATHDSVQEHLSARAATLGATLVNGDPETSAVLRRKSRTYASFGGEPWLPLVYEHLDEVDQWPVVIKPDRGQGGAGVITASTREAAEAAMAAVEEPILVEHLPGEELTVDCFTDRHRRLLWIGPRTRDRVRAGIAMRSRMIDPDDEIRSIAAAINERLTLRGPWFFQVKRSREGRWKLLEAASRVGGAMVAQRARGINLPLLAVQDHLGRDLTLLPVEQVRLIDRRIATQARLDFEFDTVWVDLDDTLIIDGHPTPVVVAFLYQMRREAKRIVLITRHELDCAETLDSACLPLRMFDDIVHITDGRPKSDFVGPRSIFIDNHFPERRAVVERHGVPAFDVDALEFLLR